jgi:hypothetical protein
MAETDETRELRNVLHEYLALASHNEMLQLAAMIFREQIERMACQEEGTYPDSVPAVQRVYTSPRPIPDLNLLEAVCRELATAEKLLSLSANRYNRPEATDIRRHSRQCAELREQLMPFVTPMWTFSQRNTS